MFPYFLSYIPDSELKSILETTNRYRLKSCKRGPFFPQQSDQVKKKQTFFFGNTCPTLAKHEWNKVCTPFPPWCQRNQKKFFLPTKLTPPHPTIHKQKVHFNYYTEEWWQGFGPASPRSPFNIQGGQKRRRGSEDWHSRLMRSCLHLSLPQKAASGRQAQPACSSPRGPAPLPGWRRHRQAKPPSRAWHSRPLVSGLRPPCLSSLILCLLIYFKKCLLITWVPRQCSRYWRCDRDRNR